MKLGSVVVDLAAEQGGNCELTQPGEVATAHGVTIIGYTDLPSRLATQASQLYGTNIRHLLTDMTAEKNGEWAVDFEDEVVRGTTVIKEGEITWPPPAPKLSAAPAAPAAPAPDPVVAEPKKSLIPEPVRKNLPLLLGGLMFWVIGNGAPASFLSHFTVFVLACFIGYMVIWNVSASLHTPLMSVTNAISSIIVIGALIQISSPGFGITLLAGLAIMITAVNITGGFAVTRRMLEMFRKD
jgi:NAD(P) transhydrogenase subunit alpha